MHEIGQDHHEDRWIGAPNNALDIPTSQSEAHDHDPTLTPPELPGDLVKKSSTRQSKTTPMPSRQT